MALPSIIQQAEADTQEKLRLETILFDRLLTMYGQIVTELVQSLGLTGTPVRADKFAPEIDGILKDHYVEVAGSFAGQLSASLPEEVMSTQEESQSIADALVLFFLIRAGEQSRIILSTLQGDLDKAVFDARALADEQALLGKPMSLQETATTAGALVNRTFQTRADTIATTETQAIAEMARATEAHVLSGLPAPTQAGTTQTIEITKEWVTMRDSRVRRPPGSAFNHVAADRQVVSVNDTFIVSGERLRWPGDTSLGASAGNIIRCRCTVAYGRREIIANRLRNPHE